jgi:exopolyphosphatase / guanosine-5'-triphosphate,3'-diphosphate pyrophosphatase
VRSVREERAAVGLGEDVERRGKLGRRRIEAAAECVERYSTIARRLGVGEIDVLVTAPGRQAAGADRLLDALAAAGPEPRVLSAQEEGELAYRGARATMPEAEGLVAVVDVGGGSTEIVTGRGLDGDVRTASLDVGSLRLTTRHLEGDPPSDAQVDAARSALDGMVRELPLQHPHAALAVGGTARGLRRVGGEPLDERRLAAAERLLHLDPAAVLARRHGLDLHRARTLLGGTLILAAVQRRLGVPFAIARGGLREGAALDLMGAAVGGR